MGPLRCGPCVIGQAQAREQTLTQLPTYAGHGARVDVAIAAYS
jgi:hypothetical protein